MPGGVEERMVLYAGVDKVVANTSKAILYNHNIMMEDTTVSR